MSDGVVIALIGAFVALTTGLLTLGGQRYVARLQSKATENETRISEVESRDHLLKNYRTDYDRCRADLESMTKQRDTWRTRALAAERVVDQWIETKET